MTPFSSHRRSDATWRPARRWAVFALVTVVTVSVPAQEPEWRLGSLEFSAATPSQPLRVSGVGRARLRSYAMVSRDGVNLEGELRLSDELSDVLFQLNYDPTRRDGERLSVVGDGREHVAPLFDWQLRPIAMFADSEFTAAVSLFGDGPNRDAYYYIEMHEAFENTLLGMRLLHANILLMNLTDHWQLPRLHGRTVLGAGERLPDSNAARDAARTLREVMELESFHAWVLTDVGAPSEVTRLDRVITARPYYAFWSARFDDYQRAFEGLTRQLDLLEPQIGAEATNITTMEAEYDAAVARGEAETATALFERYQTAQAERNRLVGQFNRLVEQRDALEPEVTIATRVTARMQTAQDELRAFNPSVYDAVVNTAGYAALFRHIRRTNPTGWTAFRAAVDDIEVVPAVRTPTMMPKPGR